MALNIIDKPNERSSHTKITIRGGGVIFLMAMLLGYVLHPTYALPVLGATVIGVISFVDDRITLSTRSWQTNNGYRTYGCLLYTLWYRV